MNRYMILFFLSIAMTSCSQQNPMHVQVSNNLDFERKEIVSIPFQDLKGLNKDDIKYLHIQDTRSKNYQRTQFIDTNTDGKNDAILFQAEVPANGKSNYLLVIDSTVVEPKSDVVAYSRFVPERTDDYTWENDKVAFRTYGPTGQKEALAGVAGSTLSSGIDLWLKRTEKTIINKWYAGHLKNPGYYHKDHGEGYDPYHVGNSRGTGGIGVWKDDSLYVSKNFTGYKTIADGPLRTVFELTYKPWSPYEIHETKRITLDLGSNFSKFEIDLIANDSLPNYTIGISLHENEGEYRLQEKEGWFRYWEAIDDSFIGEGVVINPEVVDSSLAYKSEVPDQSNILIVTKPQKTLTYYAGFAWKKSGQVEAVEDWDSLLSKQVQIIKNPLEIELSGM
ncbi:MAG: DUF4861 family protein [Leeuwenhoekiella sp.]